MNSSIRPTPPPSLLHENTEASLMLHVVIISSDRRPCLSSSGNVESLAAESALVSARMLLVGRVMPNAPCCDARLVVGCGGSRRIRDNPPYLRQTRIFCDDRRLRRSVWVSLLVGRVMPNAPCCASRLVVGCGGNRRIRDNPPYLRPTRISRDDRRPGASVWIARFSDPKGTETGGSYL